MLKKLDWMHWSLLVVALVTQAGPEVASVLGNDGFTGAAGTVTHIVGFVAFLGALMKQFKPSDGSPGVGAARSSASRVGMLMMLIFCTVFVVRSVTVDRPAHAGSTILVAGPTGCSPAQVKKIESGFQADGTLLGCVAAAAASTGGNVAAIAGICSASEIEVAEVIWDAITMKPGAAASSRTAVLAATPAAKEVVASWGPRIQAAKAARAQSAPAGL